jgi:hypothetical protein
MSYAAVDEAWRQRISQELSRAARFRETQDSFLTTISAGSNPNYIRTAPFVGMLSHTAVQEQRSQSSSQRNKRKSRLHNLLDESRRSHTPRTQQPSNQLGARDNKQYAETNPVLSTPITSRGLPTKRGVAAHQETTAQAAKAKPYRRRWVSKKSEALDETAAEPRKEVSEKEEDPIENEETADSPEGEADLEAEQADEPGELQLDDRPRTASTWKTTSSQRRYILSLETLLQEERKAREALEKKVEALLSKH